MYRYTIANQIEPTVRRETIWMSRMIAFPLTTPQIEGAEEGGISIIVEVKSTDDDNGIVLDLDNFCVEIEKSYLENGKHIFTSKSPCIDKNKTSYLY